MTHSLNRKKNRWPLFLRPHVHFIYRRRGKYLGNTRQPQGWTKTNAIEAMNTLKHEGPQTSSKNLLFSYFNPPDDVSNTHSSSLSTSGSFASARTSQSPPPPSEPTPPSLVAQDTPYLAEFIPSDPQLASEAAEGTPLELPDGTILYFPGRLSNVERALMQVHIREVSGEYLEPWDVERAIAENRERHGRAGIWEDLEKERRELAEVEGRVEGILRKEAEVRKQGRENEY